MKKIIYFIMVFLILTNRVLAEDLDIDSNAGGGGIGGAPNNIPADKNIYYMGGLEGIRIGFFKNGDSKCIARLDIVNNVSKANEEDIRCLKGQLTKIELATMYNNDELKDYIKYWEKKYKESQETFPQYKYNSIYSERMSFPSMKATFGDNSERIESVKNYFLNQDNYEKLASLFFTENKEEIKERKNLFSKDYTLVIEPLVLVATDRSNFSGKGRDRYFMTCSEYAAIGIIEECWWGSSTYDKKDGCKFPTGKLSASVYKAYPLGVFYEETDYVIGLPPSSITTMSTAISNKSQLIIMLKSMGGFDLCCGTNMQQIQVNPEKDVGYMYVNYYTDIYVITSVEVYAELGFPVQSKTPQTAEDKQAKNNALNDKICETTFSIKGANGSITQKGSIKEQESRLFWVKWKTPDISSQVTIDVKSSSGAKFLIDGISYDKVIIICNIINPVEGVEPPDTTADDWREEGDIEAEAPKHYDEVLENSWHTYGYRWVEVPKYRCSKCDEVYDTPAPGDVCSKHKCPENAEDHECPVHSGLRYEDWGYVEWTTNEFSAKLEPLYLKLELSDYTPVIEGKEIYKDEEDVETIRSGYGVKQNQVYAVITDDENTDNYVYPQIGLNYFQEFDFDMYIRRSDIIPNVNADKYFFDKGISADGYQTVRFEFPENGYSHFKLRSHYIPIYFPDDSYTVLTDVSSAYTPAGELKSRYITYVEVEGSLWDDLHIRQGN